MTVAALLDACVLYPIGLRDTLLNIAEAGYYRVLWSDQILDETARNIVADTPGLTADHLERTFAAMRTAFPDALIEGYEHRIDSMTNHPKDRHVLAAAVHAAADLVVTFNVRDFPTAACEPHSVRVETPDEFLCDIAETGTETLLAILDAQAARKRRPPMSLATVLDHLAVHIPQFVAQLRKPE